MSADSLLLLQTGHVREPFRSLTGDLPDWFARAMPWLAAPRQVVEAQRGLPDTLDWGAVIITGSACAVWERAPWSEAAAGWVAEAVAAGVPMLGVCFGHQLIAHALGGVVAPNPPGPEVGRYLVDVLEDDPLFGGLPPRFSAAQIHYDAVLEPPPGARVLARTERAIQALAYAERVRGVQFHPEFDRAYVEDALDRHGARLEELEPGSVARLQAGIDGPYEAVAVLRSFVERFTELPVRD